MFPPSGSPQPIVLTVSEPDPGPGEVGGSCRGESGVAPERTTFKLMNERSNTKAAASENFIVRPTGHEDFGLVSIAGAFRSEPLTEHGWYATS